MTDALKYEWTRLRTLRSTWWLLGTTLLLAGGVAALYAGLIEQSEGALLPALTALAGDAGPLVGILMGLVGAFAIGHEYRYGTIRVTLPVVPRRGAIWAAKTLVVALWSVLVTALSVALAYLLLLVWPGSVVLDDPTVSGDDVISVVLGYVLLVLLYALTGLALAGLLRNLPGAVVLLVVWPLIVETILVGLTFLPGLDSLREEVRFLPFLAGNQLVVVDPSVEVIPGVPPLGRWEGGAVLGGVVVVLLALWAVLFRRRDA